MSQEVTAPRAERGFPAGFSHEMQLLLLMARARLEPVQRAGILALLAQPVDWERLERVAIRQRMLPLLVLHLREFRGQVPQAVQQRLTLLGMNAARRSLRLVGELAELLARFEAEGVAALPYKGPVLAAQLYGSPALRESGDLDIVIRLGDLPRVRGILAERGYRPRHPLAPAEEAFMLRSRYGENHLHDEFPPVELHWAFTNGDIALPLGIDDLLPHAEELAIGGRRFPVFGREDLVILLCVHGTKHRWDHLEWLCGLGEAIRGATAVDWDRLVERAGRLGVRRMVLLGLMLAHDLLQAPVPTRALRQARADGAVVHAASLVPGFLAENAVGEDSVSLSTDLFRYALRERWRDRLRFVVYRITTPSQPERWAAVVVGGRVIPLHALARPFRVLSRLGALVRRRPGPAS